MYKAIKTNAETIRNLASRLSRLADELHVAADNVDGHSEPEDEVGEIKTIADTLTAILSTTDMIASVVSDCHRDPMLFVFADEGMDIS